MALSRSIAVAHVSLLIGFMAFLCVPVGCSGSDEDDKARVGGEAGTVHNSAAANEGVAETGEESAESDDEGKEAGESERREAEEPKQRAESAAAEKPATPAKGVVVGNTVPCATCHSDQTKAKHVVWGVACVSCHLQTAAHLKDPSVKPQKPKVRADCFKCHSAAASPKSGAPKQVDSHGRKAPCVSCHSIHKTKGD